MEESTEGAPLSIQETNPENINIDESNLAEKNMGQQQFEEMKLDKSFVEVKENDEAGQLSEEELKCATELKKTVEESADLPNQSDFMYVQYAIVAKGDTKKALRRLKKTVSFLDSYKIEEISSLQAVDWMESAFPDFIFAAEDDNLGRPILCMRYRAFSPKAVKTEQDMKYMLKGFLDMIEASTNDFDYTRRGCIFIADCGNIGWSNFSEEIERTFANLYQDAYPLRFEDMYMLDAPVLMKVLIQICSIFIKKKLRDRMHLMSLEQFQQIETFGEQGGALPPQLGGRCQMTYREWLFP
eukprot:CAMPEP_0117763182 /NCGR_PEP_ID=MMETSP0947-20121206/18462_1 /TAXON_ID=44440 /ORGANISM="Chattonella subsalsa, Strain CCMP2191" /LENGTH=297 /DNA_ID=CAMNT_0005584793 /DNA_START=52 /DNA_END=942 /DNA_ORIENTATION=-